MGWPDKLTNDLLSLLKDELNSNENKKRNNQNRA